LAQISKLLAFKCIKKYQFVAKTDRNFIFHGCEAHILDQLYIIVMYISFNRLKNTNFGSKYKGVSLRFYRQTPVCGKNWTKLRISLPWIPYFTSLIYNGHVYKFLRVKKINFGSKYKGVSIQFYRKCQFCVKTDRSSVFLSRETHILN
jgi:hypothetical protein